MKSIQDGKVMRLSASMLGTFDENDRFGCQRRGYFKYVLGVAEPSSAAQNVGTSLHADNEDYLDSRGRKVSGAVSPLFNAGRPYLDSIMHRVKATETEVKYSLDGVPGIGYVDCVLDNEPGVVDWKTSSDIRRYGKTAKDLESDKQMILYAWALPFAGAPRVQLVHGQYQTKGRVYFQAAETWVTQETIAQKLETVILPLVKQVKHVAQLDNVREAKADRTKCFLCPHKSICPSEGDEVMALFFKKPAETAATPNPVVPPDAPASNPALASIAPKETAPVVAETAPVTEVSAETGTKKRGRPPGSKNRVTIVDVDAPKVEAKIEPKVEVTPAPHVDSPVAIHVRRVSVHKSMTLQPVQFNPVRFEVTLEADASDATVAYRVLAEQAEKLISDDMNRFMEDFRAKTGVQK